MKSRVLIAGVLLVAASASAPAADPPSATVKFPGDYRTWPHVTSMVIFSDKHPLFATFGGIHHIYVNKTGLKASQSRGTYPDGAVLVFDLLEATEDSGAYVAGGRKVVAVMQKDAKRFKNTGGWGFEAFKSGGPGERLVRDPTGQCFSCHATQKDHDYVYSTLRD